MYHCRIARIEDLINLRNNSVDASNAILRAIFLDGSVPVVSLASDLGDFLTTSPLRVLKLRMCSATTCDSSPENAIITSILVQRDGCLSTSQASTVQDPWNMRSIQRRIRLDARECSMLGEVGLVGASCGSVLVWIRSFQCCGF